MLYNDSPLIITNTNLLRLPPTVVYIHGETAAVPVKFKVNNAPFWNAGDIFGYLVLAGHGTITNDCTESNAVQPLLNGVFGPLGSPAKGMPVEWLRTSDLYPSSGVYGSLTGSNFFGQTIDFISFTIARQGTLYLRNLKLGPFPNPIPPPPPTTPAVYSLAATPATFDLSVDGQNWFPASASGSFGAVISNMTVSGSSLSNYSAQVIQLNLNGNGEFGPVMLRQDPSIPSMGQHTIRASVRLPHQQLFRCVH